MASRIFALLSFRRCRCWRAAPLRAAGPLALALPGGRAPLRVGVGRPLPPSLSGAAGAAGSAVLLRRNNGLLPRALGRSPVGGPAGGEGPRLTAFRRAETVGNLLLRPPVGP